MKKTTTTTTRIDCMNHPKPAPVLVWTAGQAAPNIRPALNAAQSAWYFMRTAMPAYMCTAYRAAIRTQCEQHQTPSAYPALDAGQAAYYFFAEATPPEELAQAVLEWYNNPDYNQFERNTARALSARYSKSGTQLFKDLQDERTNDTSTRTAADRENIAGEHRANAEQLRTLARKEDAKSKRLTLPESDRIQAAYNAINLTNAADEESEKAQVITATVLDATYSDRADMTQEAALQWVINTKYGIELSETVVQDIRKKAKLTEADELTPEQVGTALARSYSRARTNAAGRASQQLAHPDARNSTYTKLEQITKEAAEDWKAHHGNMGDNYRKDEKTRYITLEERHSKRYDGFYLIYHYKTIAPYTSWEQLDEAGNAEYFVKSYNPFIESQGTAEQLAEILKAANLTERERMFVLHLTSTQADTAGIKAREEYDKKHPPRPNASKRDQQSRHRERENVAFEAAKRYAFTRLEITNSNTRKSFYKRLLEKLDKANKARKAAKHTSTPAERESRAVKAAMKNRDRIHYDPAGNAYTAPQDVSRACWIDAPEPKPETARKLDEQCNRYFADYANDIRREIDNAQESTSTPAQLAKAQQEYTTRAAYCWRMIAYHGNSAARAYMGRQTPQALLVLAQAWKPLAQALQDAQKANTRAALDVEHARKMYDKFSTKDNLKALQDAQKAYTTAQDALTLAQCLEERALQLK